MLIKLLKRENVKIFDSVSDWEEAIFLATKGLIEQGFVTSDYPQKIIELTKEYGAYYILAPNIALIHARPEDGVIDNQIAITLLRKPVFFDGNGRSAKLLITLAAKNSKDHLEALKSIGELIMDKKRVIHVLNSRNEKVLFNEFISREE